MLDIYGQLAIGHVKGLKEARRSAPKSEIRLQRRARETGGWWWCMPQGIGLAAGFCCFSPPIGWPLFRNLAEISRNDHCWPPPLASLQLLSCSCAHLHSRMTSPVGSRLPLPGSPANINLSALTVLGRSWMSIIMLLLSFDLFNSATVKTRTTPVTARHKP
jgi:hypothetical protein